MNTIGNQAAVYDQLGLARQETDQKAKNPEELGQEEFLKLMTTQLNHQDPFNPMENGDFLAQMAQFATVSGISGLQDQFTAFADAMRGNQLLEASTLVDREVMVASDLAPMGADAQGRPALSGAVEIDRGADQVQVGIFRLSGEQVVGGHAQ